MSEIDQGTLQQIEKLNPGDYAVYCVRDDRLITLSFSGGLPGLSGLTRDEYMALTGERAEAIVLESDRRLVAEKIRGIARDRDGSKVVSVTYRIFHKDLGFVWVRARAKTIGTRQGDPVILVSFATMAAGSREYVTLLNENQSSIYVVDKKTFELLFVNEPALRHCGKQKYQNEKCYSFFNGLEVPCPWCSLPAMKDGYGHLDENYVPPLKKWYRHDVRDIHWYGHDAAAFYIADITGQKKRQEDYEERFNNLYKEIASANPNAMAMFRLNLTKNICSDVQTKFDAARRQQASGTVEGYLAACAEIIIDDGIQEDCRRRFNLPNLIREFHNGVTEMAIEYPIRSQAGQTIWINGVIVMLQNSITDDIEGIAYALNITDQRISGMILERIAEEKYDHIGLISPVRHSYELWKKDDALDLAPHETVDYDGLFNDIHDHYILAEDRDLYKDHGQLEHITARLDENGEDHFVYRYIDPRGRCVYKQVTYGWLDSQKDLILETQTDLTELYEKQIELVRQQHEAELARERALSVESIPSGVGVFDVTEGNIALNYINSGFFQMLGIPPEEKDRYFSKAVVNNVLADDRKVFYDAVHEAMGKNRQLNCRLRLSLGEKEPHWVEIVANHVPLDGTTERFYVSYYDVDHLIRVQNELREKELTYRDILSYSEIIHFTYYLAEHRYKVEVQPEKYHMLPGTVEDYPASLIRLLHLNEKDAAVYKDMIAAIDAGEKEAECTVYVNQPGIAGWYRTHLMSVADEKGKPCKAIGNVFNVDRTVEAEKAISDERFRMESLGGIYLATACFSVKRDLEITFNRTGDLAAVEAVDPDALAEARAVEPTIDRQRPETLRSLLAAAGQIPDPEQRQAFIRACSHAGMLRAFREGNRDVTLEYRRFVGKKLIWVSTRIILMEEPSTGDILSFFYTRDIHQMKQNEQIRKLVLENRCDYFALLNVKSRTLAFNGSAHIERTLCCGFDAGAENPYDEGVRQAVRRFFDPARGEALLAGIGVEKITASLQDSPAYSVVYDWKAEDGTRLRKQILYQWLDGTKEDILVVESDITGAFRQEQQRERQLQDALEAAERANQAKTEFISRISHDVRTPIGAIQNMTAFAREDLDDRQKLLSDLDKIEVSNTLLLSLINDVLDISKIDSGKIELHPEPYLYDDYIETIRNLFEPLCQQKGLTLSIQESRTGRGHGVLVDHVRYNQISLNLLSNAVKYTPAGGTITYTSHSEKRGDGFVALGFEVGDTGIGMSEAFQAKMFEPFSQELDNPARNKQVGGTGLGLSIVKKLVDLMGGRMTVESELGRGTKIAVSFVLPAAAAADREPGEAPGAPADEHLDGRILLVEDNAINTEIATRILEAFGLEITHAGDGKQAVDRFEQSAPGEFAGILMDIQMPVMNGYEATRAIRALDRPDARRVPIIAMTADAFEESVRTAQKAGMDDYVTKPIDPQGLYGILEKAVGGGKG